jgi:protein regulator of cytokinesis 1
MLTSHQDKLLNIYQAKHDQLIGNVSDVPSKIYSSYELTSHYVPALSNRLHSLGNTLGSGFFPPDILSSRASLDASLQDVTPDRFSKLEKELVRGKSELARRLSQFSTTVTQIIFLYCDLGMSIPSADVASTLVDEKIDPRELIIARHAARIDEAEDEGLGEEVLGVEGVDPTVDLMEWAEALKIALEDEKTRREDYIQGMYDQLEILWKRLGVEEQETDAFVEENSGTAPSNVQAVIVSWPFLAK